MTALVPKWPDFSFTKHDRGVALMPDGEGLQYVEIGPEDQFIRFSTDTGRPITPVFTAVVKGYKIAEKSDEELYRIGRKELDKAFKAAHPNGCPKRHDK